MMDPRATWDAWISDWRAVARSLGFDRLVPHETDLYDDDVAKVGDFHFDGVGTCLGVTGLVTGPRSELTGATLMTFVKGSRRCIVTLASAVRPTPPQGRWFRRWTASLGDWLDRMFVVRLGSPGDLALLIDNHRDEVRRSGLPVIELGPDPLQRFTELNQANLEDHLEAQRRWRPWP